MPAALLAVLLAFAVTGCGHPGPSVVEPAVVIPATIDVTNITDTFKTEYDELVALLADKLTGFLTTYFPNDKVDYAAAESFLIDSLASDSGIPAAVQAQILTEDKDRILAEAARASDSVVQSFASRRFPMPPGAAGSAPIRVDRGATQSATFAYTRGA